MPRLSIPDILQQECGMNIRENDSSVVSSPFRSDNSPSFRIYYHPEEDDGKSEISREYSCFDWGTGQSYNPISLIHELRGHDSWGQTFDYIRENYGVSLSKSEQSYDNKLPESIRLIMSSVYLNKDTAPKIEQAILSFLGRNDKPMNDLLANTELTI